MLLTVQGELPNTFNFLRLYKNGIPPSVSNKRKEIVEKAKLQGFPNIECMFSEIVRIDIRNAFFHSDYIIYNNELRLKHRGSEYKKIPAQEVFSLLNKTLHFFDKFMNLLHEGRRSFPIGYKITGRKDSKGNILSSVNLLVDEKTGVLTGFSTSDPLPLW
jgi:hypothetical protein